MNKKELIEECNRVQAYYEEASNKEGLDIRQRRHYQGIVKGIVHCRKYIHKLKS